MYKLRVVCLFLLLSLYPYNADAKVCFLPGVLAGDGCMLGEVVVDCDGYTRTTPCPSNYNSETCKKNGRTYYKCTCKSGNYSMPSNKYICKGDYDATCGCAAEHTYCNTRAYPFENCGAYGGADPSAADSCIDPADNTPHYKSCGCSETLYPYDCKEKGLKESRLASKCTDSSGKAFYSFCDCADSWTTEPCSENSTGCTRMLDHVNRGGGMGYCYSCGTEICPIPGNRNLAGYFCNVTPTTTTDCQALGYTTLDKGDGLCSDGTKGIKCVFDPKYLFCEKPDDCPYPTKKYCLRFNKYSNCVQGRNGCWKPVGCAEGYYTSVEGCAQTDLVYIDKCGTGIPFYTKLAGQDSNGCGYCASEYSSCTQTPYQYTCSSADEYNYQGCYLYRMSKGKIAACCEEKHKFWETCEAAGMYDYDARDDIDIYSGVYIFTQKVGLMGKTCYKNICEGVPEATCNKDFTPKCTAKGWVVYGECKCKYDDKEHCENINHNSECTEQDNGCYQPTKCKSGYYKEVNDENCRLQSGEIPLYETLGGKDEYGCGYCSTSYQSCSQYLSGSYAYSATDNYYYASCSGYLYLSNGQNTKCCRTRNRYYDKCEDLNYYPETKVNADISSAVTVYMSKQGDQKTCYTKLCAGVSESACVGTFTQACTAVGSVAYGTCEYACKYSSESACTSDNVNSKCSKLTDNCYAPTGCKSGYFQEDDASKCSLPTNEIPYYTRLDGYDNNGCGYCISDYTSCQSISSEAYVYNDNDNYFYSKCGKYYLNNGDVAQCCLERNQIYENCEAAGYKSGTQANADVSSEVYIYTSKLGASGEKCYTKLCSGTPRSECNGTFTKTCTGVSEDYGTCS